MSRAVPLALGAIGALVFAGLWQWERAARYEALAHLAARTAEVSALRTAAEVTEDTITRLLADRTHMRQLLDQQEAAHARALAHTEEELARTQAATARQRHVARARPGLYGKLHDKATAQLMADFAALTCRVDCAKETRDDPS